MGTTFLKSAPLRGLDTVNVTITLHQNDIPADLDLGDSIAVDTETMGLNPVRDRLCVVQLSSGDGTAHLVQFDGKDYSAPNLKKLLGDPKVLKIMHFGRFDIATMWMYMDVLSAPVYCTRIASRIARTFSPYHSLKGLCRDLLGLDISKQQQTSDWGSTTLTEDQMAYAANDVLHLHKIKDALDASLKREGRTALAQACFDFLPHRAMLDIAGWGDEDIFAHS